MYQTYPSRPELFTIHAASLDDPGRFSPQAVTYAARAHPWDPLDPAMPTFAGMPTA